MYVACLSAGTITYTGPTSYVADAVDVSDTTVYAFSFLGSEVTWTNTGC